ncbi:MAG TPA: hypothetical protein VH396_07625 [Chitinophagaceae bacterium]
MISAKVRPRIGKKIIGTIVTLTKDEVIAIANQIIIIESSFRLIKGSCGFIKAIMTVNRKIIPLSIGNSIRVLVVEKNKVKTRNKLKIPVYTQL